mmetsp:Transcript_35208/g.34235  ORF Transcript_35208/g.34235 Transcript_35208/m.34235 type:complete len:80 (+) Transcript_35208:454-693(+)
MSLFKKLETRGTNSYKRADSDPLQATMHESQRMETGTISQISSRKRTLDKPLDIDNGPEELQRAQTEALLKKDLFQLDA